jgi:predicted transcriptional regulator
MHRSKLELYEVILGAIVKKPLSIDRLAYRTTMDCTLLSKCLAFLMANGVIERRTFGDETFFAITERGVTVFRTLDFQKYLRKLSKTWMTMDEAMQDIPVVLKRRQKPPE